MEQYKIVEMNGKTYDVKNRFYVLQLCYINRDNRGKYRLVKQCSSIEKAKQYIESKLGGSDA